SPSRRSDAAADSFWHGYGLCCATKFENRLFGPVGSAPSTCNLQLGNRSDAQPAARTRCPHVVQLHTSDLSGQPLIQIPSMQTAWSQRAVAN
ncbi:unnamed protein product, partial [Ectocarpus sp. 12 AP-2014]